MISSCASGYATGINSRGPEADCADPICSIDWTCEYLYETLEPGASLVATWDGKYHTFEAFEDCTCYRAGQAPAGKYRATFEVQSHTATDAGLQLSVDFDYPDDDGWVVVEL